MLAFPRAVIEIVLKDDTSGKALSADETVDLISNQNVRDQLASQQFTVSKIDQGEFTTIKQAQLQISTFDLATSLKKFCLHLKSHRKWNE